MKRAMLLGLLCALTGWPILTRAAEGFRGFKDGTWEVGAAGSFFYSEGNYNNSGSQNSLAGGDAYSLLGLEFDARGSFGGWALKGGFDVGNAESKGTTATRTNSTVTGAGAGFEWVTDFGAMDLIPEIGVWFPFEKVDGDQDSVMNTEGVMLTNFFLTAQTPFESFNLLTGIGYTLRDGGRSNLLPWKVYAEFLGEGLSYGAGLKGYQSVQDDKDTGSSTEEARRQVAVNRVNAGSCRFYCLNPSIIELGGFVNVDVSRRFTLNLFGDFTVTGANAAAGWTLGAGLTMNFSSVAARKKAPNLRDRLSIDPSSDDFMEDTDDGIDQKLFTPPKPPPPPRPSKPAAPAPDPFEKDHERIDHERNEALKQQLNEAEMTIELRSNKKRRRSR